MEGLDHMGRFRFLDDIATSDVAVEVIGDSIEDLFEMAANALFEIMVDTNNIANKTKKMIYLKAEDVERLLFGWLSELVYLKDAEGLLCGGYYICIRCNNDWELSAEVTGEEIDYRRDDLRSDVKAVTYHQFQVYQRDERWIARLVFDV